MKNSISYQSYEKSPYKSIKHSTYFDVYDEIFSRYRGKKITFVEIGVLSGGSLFMWRDFFGAEANIIGIDLNPNAKKWKNHGFDIYIGSQSDVNFWSEFKKIVGSIDIVLDDGGHTYAQQITTVEMLLENINDGGMVVIEDTHTSYLNGYGSRRYSFINYVKKCIDKINFRYGKFDQVNSDTRIWSIQTFESIVAFHVNKRASNLKSEPTINNGVDDLANDFRNMENKSDLFFDGILVKFHFMKNIPCVRRVALRARNFFIDHSSKNRLLKKYF